MRGLLQAAAKGPDKKLESGDSLFVYTDGVKEDIDAFVDGGPQFDDITMLAFRYNGKQ